MKRSTPLRRTGFKHCDRQKVREVAEDGRPDGQIVAKLILMPTKVCKIREGGCGKLFRPKRALQLMCSPLCAENHATQKRLKAEEKARRENRIQTREQKEAAKSKPALEKEVRYWMHKWVRLRDQDKGCISSGKAFTTGALGGDFDAGHFRSVGSAPHLKFDERNIHGQSKYDNQFLAGNPVGYERGLRARYGDQMVDELLADDAPRKHTKDDLRAMREHYKVEASRLAKDRSGKKQSHHAGQDGAPLDAKVRPITGGDQADESDAGRHKPHAEGAKQHPERDVPSRGLNAQGQHQNAGKHASNSNSTHNQNTLDNPHINPLLPANAT